MATLVFDESDVELLYSFPQPPSDLSEIIRCFMFINRAAPPTYDEVASCLIKAMKAGIVREDGGKYVTVKEWYDRIHREDATAGNEIQSMINFADSFVNVELERTTEAGRVPTEAEFAWMLRHLR